MLTRPHVSMDDTSIGSSKSIIQSRIPSTLDSNQERRSSVLKSPIEGGHGAVGAEAFLALSPSYKPDATPALAPYISRQYNQLPTPQSPNNRGFYFANTLYTPESPTSSSHLYVSNPPAQRAFLHKIIDGEVPTPVKSQQTVTPESSPLARNTPSSLGNATPRQIRPAPSQKDLSTPRTKLPLQESALFSSRLAPPYRISSPASSSSDSRTSHLSSPFMEKLVMINPSKFKITSHPRPQLDSSKSQLILVDDIPHNTTISNQSDATLPSSSVSPPKSPPQATAGEMEGVRQAMLPERLAHYQDVESRRPEYMKRTKRSQSDGDLIIEEDTETSIGITESPMKGRRLKLFQETSDESFEESLMAGGYGRYRTTDWVRQPQPTLLTTPGASGPSNIVSILEQAQEPAPPTEKELRKRKRLAAFTERTSSERVTKPHPVEIEGCGRVLWESALDGDDPSMADGSSYKKKGASRRKKKSDLTPKDKKAQALAPVATGYSPNQLNWPDAEFPWKLRTQEREEQLKAEEAEKLKTIERFLDRDSDDEEDGDVLPRGFSGEASVRRVQGKVISLSRNLVGMQRTSLLFPSDPADARAALRSKKSVRTLLYRQKKRRRHQDENDDEVLCICNGKDDGRELVQCDDCQTWYHLDCIGIRDISELGKEEDPWFCRRCEQSLRSSSSEPEFLSEPTFVPTDDRPRISPSFDAPFFQSSSLQDSPTAWDTPRMPRTPTQGHVDYETEMSSGSTWVESSRKRPMTSQHVTPAPRVYTHTTPGPFDSYDSYDEPFDPTSTPSRGIKFGAPFATPKTGLWSSRPSGLFQTPLKTGVGRTTSGKPLAPPGTLPFSFDDSGHGVACDRSLHDDESPIRRVKSHEGPKARRVMDSPLASRSTLTMPYHLLEESPIMRYNAEERRHQMGP